MQVKSYEMVSFILTPLFDRLDHQTTDRYMTECMSNLSFPIIVNLSIYIGYGHHLLLYSIHDGERERVYSYTHSLFSSLHSIFPKKLISLWSFLGIVWRISKALLLKIYISPFIKSPPNLTLNDWVHMSTINSN